MCWTSLVESKAVDVAQSWHTSPVWWLQWGWKLACCAINIALFSCCFLLAVVTACLVISSSRLSHKQREDCSSLIKCWAYLYVCSFYPIFWSANRSHKIFISVTFVWFLSPLNLQRKTTCNQVFSPATARSPIRENSPKSEAWLHRKPKYSRTEILYRLEVLTAQADSSYRNSLHFSQALLSFTAQTIFA